MNRNIFYVAKTVFFLLTKSQRKKYFQLQIIVMVTVFFEILGISLIGLFMSFISNPDNIFSNSFALNVYDFFNFKDKYNAIYYFGLSVIFFLILSSIISMYTTWRLAIFASRIGVELGDRLFEHYMYQSWTFHTEENSSQLVKKITSEVNRLTMSILNPLIIINTRIFVAISIVILLFFINPIVAIIGLVLFTSLYLTMYYFVRKELGSNSKKFSVSLSGRYSLVTESLGGIKEIIILARQKYFIDRFRKYGKGLWSSQGNNQAFAHMPKYFIELVSFSLIIMLVMYLINNNNGDLQAVLPLLSMYALAGFKLLPAFQQIYSGVAQIKGNVSAFYSIENDLIESNYFLNNKDKKIDAELDFEKSIVLKDVGFSYSKNKIIIKKMNIVIPINKTVGIVGGSGSGKSTLINIIMGLLKPTEGDLLVDGKKITAKNISLWQKKLGHVSQYIYLSDASIAENIAFGIAKEDIDYGKIKEAVQLSSLDKYIDELPHGLETVVGERGVQLSGGQRQRIGIARALYRNVDTLLLDEATSSLDGLTESLIMESMYDLSKNKTVIIIAHRIKTIKKCDLIFHIEDGDVVNSGTYLELMDNSEEFRQMSTLA
jgi:ABC-type multidrug transport system fused ATPase/permease subunit